MRGERELRKFICGLLMICLVLGFASCGNPASEVSGYVSEESAQEITRYAMGYSLEQIGGLTIAFPEKVEAYPFEDHLPGMFSYNGVSPVGLQDRFEDYPSLKADLINFIGGWTMAELHWNQPDGVAFPIPVMFLQAYNKSDIDGGMKVQYLSHTRNDLCVELSKEQLMQYLWTEFDGYYIIDFLDVYIDDYRVFACDAALHHLDTAEYQDDTQMYLDFNTFLDKIDDVRNEIKHVINIRTLCSGL